jgi:hypothetical protein
MPPFLFFSFILPVFYPFTANVTRVLPVEAIKGEAGATAKGEEATIARIHLSRNNNHHHHQETWDPLPLSKACNPYYEHRGVRQHEPWRNPLDVGSFIPEPVYILVFALHTIKA